MSSRRQKWWQKEMLLHVFSIHVRRFLKLSWGFDIRIVLHYNLYLSNHIDLYTLFPFGRTMSDVIAKRRIFSEAAGGGFCDGSVVNFGDSSIKAGIGKCPFLRILNITFKYLLHILSPIVGWCSIGTFTNPCKKNEPPTWWCLLFSWVQNLEML